MGTKVNERTFIVATVTYKDQDGAAITPSAASYRIDDKTSKTEVTDWTTITTPTTSDSITVTSNENRILNSNNNTETRQLTVKATDPTTSEDIYSAVSWDVVNLLGTT